MEELWLIGIYLWLIFDADDSIIADDLVKLLLMADLLINRLQSLRDTNNCCSESIAGQGTLFPFKYTASGWIVVLRSLTRPPVVPHRPNSKTAG